MFLSVFEVILFAEAVLAFQNKHNLKRLENEYIHIYISQAVYIITFEA